MKRFIISFVAILILASLLITGCTSQPGATTTPPQTAAQATISAAPKTTAGAAATAPTATSAPSQVIELKFSHHNPPQAWTTAQFLNPWAKKVEEATKGAVKITMFPAQSIASMQDNYDATISNLAQMTWITINAYPGRFPLSDVISLPFLSLPSGTINGKKVTASVVNSHIIQELYETQSNIQKEWSQTKVLFLHTSSPYLLVTKKPIKTIADVKGMKIAVLGTGPNLEMWKKVEASPLYLVAPSVYESGQKGVVDACSTNWANIGTYRLNEVFPYAIDMSTSVTHFALVMNLEAWNKMPQEVQNQIMSVSGQAGSEFAGDSAFGDNVQKDVMDKIKAQGSKLEIVSLNPGEQDKMKTLAGKPIWDDWVASLKAKGLPADTVLDATLKLLDKYK